VWSNWSCLWGCRLGACSVGSARDANRGVWDGRRDFSAALSCGVRVHGVRGIQSVDYDYNDIETRRDIAPRSTVARSFIVTVVYVAVALGNGHAESDAESGSAVQRGRGWPNAGRQALEPWCSRRHDWPGVFNWLRAHQRHALCHSTSLRKRWPRMVSCRGRINKMRQGIRSGGTIV